MLRSQWRAIRRPTPPRSKNFKFRGFSCCEVCLPAGLRESSGRLGGFSEIGSTSIDFRTFGWVATVSYVRAINIRPEGLTATLFLSSWVVRQLLHWRFGLIRGSRGRKKLRSGFSRSVRFRFSLGAFVKYFYELMRFLCSNSISGISLINLFVIKSSRQFCVCFLKFPNFDHNCNRGTGSMQGVGIDLRWGFDFFFFSKYLKLSWQRLKQNISCWGGDSWTKWKNPASNELNWLQIVQLSL